MSLNKERTLSRDIEASLIPAGDKVTLPAGTKVFITQTLGGSFTVMTDTGLVRIAGEFADALGEAASTYTFQPSMSADGSPDPEAIWGQLKMVYDPEIPVNIVDLGLVYSMDVEKKEDNSYKVNVAMTLTAPGCGMGPVIAEDAKNKVLLVPGVADADVRISWDPPWNQSMISEEGKMKLGLI